MTKRTLLITPVLLLTICACSNNTHDSLFNPNTNAVKLLIPVEAKKPEYSILDSDGFKQFKNHFASYSAEFTEEYFNTFGYDNENKAISPLSVYFAFAQAANCAAENTRTEITNALKMDMEEISKYTRVLYDASNYEGKTGKEMVSNSFWFEKTLQLNQNTVKTLVDNYGTETYEADFINKSKEVSNVFNKYVEDKTNGLIKPHFNFDDLTRFLIANTLYVKDAWNDEGKPLKEYYDNKFVQGDGTSVDKKYYATGYFTGNVADFDDFTSARMFSNSGFEFRFMLPKGNKKIQDIFTKDNLMLLHNAEYESSNEEGYIYLTRCILPLFEAGTDEDIKPVMNKMGVTDLFTDNCNFENITSEDVYADSVTHIAKLLFKDDGFEGAAVTVIEIKATSIGPENNIYRDFILDKAFGFELLDRNGFPMFTGVVNC